MVRHIVAVIAGLVAGGVIIMAVIMLSWVRYPSADGADMSDPETMHEPRSLAPAA